MNRLIPLMFVSFIVSSCAFDKMFLIPDKIPANAKSTTFINYQTGDTLTLYIGDKFQPTFTNKLGDTVALGYKIECVLFNNSIGNRLNGWIITPDSGFNGTTVLFLHGNAGNIINHYIGVVPLVKQGFAVFIIDYSGFGFSEGRATRDNVLLDATAALKYLVKRTEINTEKLVVYGQSLGGHLAITLAAQNEELVDGIIVEGAFSSHKNIAAETAGILGRILVAEKYSGLKSIKKFNKPVLIIHSMEDESIPFEHGKQLYEHANEPKTFYEIEKCHICGLLYYSDSIVSKINVMTK